MASVVLNGNTYNDGNTPPGNLGNDGHRTNFMPLLNDMLVEIAAVVDVADDVAADKTTTQGYSDAAAQSAADAAAAAATATTGLLYGTSSSSNSIGTGAKTFILVTNRQFAANQDIKISDSANPLLNYMYATVTSYNSSSKTIVCEVTEAYGSGTITSWNIAVVGAKGATGSQDFTGLTALGALSPLDLTIVNDVSASNQAKKVTLGAMIAFHQIYGTMG